MSLIKTNYFFLFTKNQNLLVFLSENSVWNYYFYLLLFLLIWFIYNIIINNLITINLFNKKHLFFLKKKRQLIEIFLKFLNNSIFLKIYKKTIFNKLI